MFQKILVAIDDSVIHEYVFNEALGLAKATVAHLMLLHVLTPQDEGYPPTLLFGPGSIGSGLSEEVLSNYTQQLKYHEQRGLELLRSLNEQAIAAGVTAEFAQNFGDPGQVICNVARTWEADLIVMGRRGLSGLSEFLFGSVSNYVIHHTSCSVLAVRGQVKTPSESEH
jgi:nucleotide-binding universal stress UspA family protein